MTKTKIKSLKLTSRGRYAVMALVELAHKMPEERWVPLSEIAHSGNISLSYLEQLFAGLRKNGLVRSYRGPGGGYLLAKDPSEIKLSEILMHAEDCVPAKRSRKTDKADAYGNKQTHALWGHIGEMLYVCTQHITLKDIMGQNVHENENFNKLIENFG
ncbi:MAG: Rrf2 family transcriptional regulator [Pseudomonadota bacterium]|nr:Rrf2 family transcriptional regulator [Pseudomonadota bacterium]